MRSYTLPLVLLLALYSLPHGGWAQQGWTLQQCIDQATAHNLSIEEARIRIEHSRLQLNSAQHAYLPSAGAQLSQSFDLGRSADKTGVLQDRSSTSSSLGVNVSWTLFSGLSRPRSIDVAQLDLQAAKVGLTVAQERVALQVAEAFYRLLYQQELIPVAQNKMQLTQEMRRKAESLVSAGKWSRDKLAEMDAQLAADSVALLQRQNEAELARYQLALLLEIPNYHTLQISAPQLEASLETPAPELAWSETTLLDQARALRPEMEQARLEIEGAKRRVLLSKSGYIPTVALGAGYSNGYYYVLNEDMRGMNLPFEDQIRSNGRYYVGLTLSIPIFDQMRTANEIRQAKIQLQEREVSLRQADKELARQISTATINARAAHGQISATQQAERSAQTALEYAQISFEAGRISTYELAEAQNRYVLAQSEVLRARYDYLYKILILQSYIQPSSFGSEKL